MISLLGQASVTIRIGRQSEVRTLLVSEDLSDLILGIDWLTDNSCVWDFSAGRVSVNGVWIQLYKQPSSHSLMRIYAREDTIVSAGTLTNVPTHIVWPHLRPGLTALVTEPRIFSNGILGAKTVLPPGRLTSAIRVVNVSDKDYLFSRRANF